MWKWKRLKVMFVSNVKGKTEFKRRWVEFIPRVEENSVIHAFGWARILPQTATHLRRDGEGPIPAMTLFGRPMTFKHG
jgi:hypothetical protein